MSITQLLGWFTTLLTIWGIGDIIFKIYKATKGQKMRAFVQNPYGKMLLFTVPSTFIIFFFPWNKIHFGDEKPKIVYKHDTIKQVLIEKKPAQIKIETTQPTKRVSYLKVKRSQLGKQDTSKKLPIPEPQFDLKGATISQSAIGTNPTVTNNNYGIKQRHLSDPDLKMILSKVDKNIKIWLAVSGGEEGENYAIEIMQKLIENGYDRKKISIGAFEGGNGNYNFDVHVSNVLAEIAIYPARNVQ